MIRLSSLGAVDLRGPAGDEFRALLAQPKRLALLAYLAAAHPAGLYSRDTLLALLWPDLNQEHGRAALRHALYVLRQSLGEGIMVTCGDGVVGLDHRHLWCDVTAFNCALDQENPADALALYGGELLTVFHVAGMPEFERWVDVERAQVVADAAAAVWRLSDGIAEGDLGQALHWGCRLVAMCPDDECALRRVVGLHHQVGDRGCNTNLPGLQTTPEIGLRIGPVGSDANAHGSSAR